MQTLLKNWWNKTFDTKLVGTKLAEIKLVETKLVKTKLFHVFYVPYYPFEITTDYRCTVCEISSCSRQPQLSNCKWVDFSKEQPRVKLSNQINGFGCPASEMKLFCQDSFSVALVLLAKVL